MALDHAFFYRCGVHSAVLFVLLVSVGGNGAEGWKRKDGDICSSTLTRSFSELETLGNTKAISSHIMLAAQQWF